MTLIPWRHKPKSAELASLSDLRHELDRLFDAFMRDPFGSLSDAMGNQRGWLPAIDVAENDQEVTVRAEIPGVAPEELDISVTGKQLTISGEKKQSSHQEGNGFHLAETRFGAFRRSIDLPSAVDPEHVSAECDQGVLTIKLAKTAAAAGHRVEIKSS
jgi:HSP20 family protein